MGQCNAHDNTHDGMTREDHQNKEVWFDEDCGEWSFGKFENGYEWTFGWNQIKGVEVVGKKIFPGQLASKANKPCSKAEA